MLMKSNLYVEKVCWMYLMGLLAISFVLKSIQLPIQWMPIEPDRARPIAHTWHDT